MSVVVGVEMASRQDPGLGGLPGQPAGLRGGRVGGRVGLAAGGERGRAAAERHARPLQLRRQGHRYPLHPLALRSYGRCDIRNFKKKYIYNFR